MSTMTMTVFAPHYSRNDQKIFAGAKSRVGSKGIGFPLGIFFGKIYAGRKLLRDPLLNFQEEGHCVQVTFLPAGDFMMETMTDYEKICDFQNLYRAHTIARKGKRTEREVIEFELNLSENLAILSDALNNGTYSMSGYYSFMVHDPKDRVIHALHYRDRVVQHCICDQVLAPTLDKKLIFDNAACRPGKGTHFAIHRLSGFMHDFYSEYGTDGYFLKCDIRKFFDNVDHDILKNKLRKVFSEDLVFSLLCHVIDSFEKTPGKGLPLGNQTSQWFAIYYLDSFDRLLKERLHIKYYSRYMDDCVLIHRDKRYLQQCLSELRDFAENELRLTLNEKTDIFPIQNGVDYLGWHFYISDTGKIIRKAKQSTKYKYKRKLRHFEEAYAAGCMELSEIAQVISSYHAHLSFGHTYRLQEKLLNNFVLRRDSETVCEIRRKNINNDGPLDHDL